LARATHLALQTGPFGIGAAREWLFNEFVRVGSGRLRVEYDTFQANVQGRITEQQNVVATLPGDGTYPGVIVLMAHYDSRTVDPFDGSSFAPGANDNGSGVALMLETARLLSAYEWSQTIVFVATAAEEQQTWAAVYFVTSRLLAGWQIDAVLNFDIVGGRPGVPQFIRVFADGDSTTVICKWLAMSIMLVAFICPPLVNTLRMVWIVRGDMAISVNLWRRAYRPCA
jgi:Zn-dependent M28 family amino/carboxypeptidase